MITSRIMLKKFYLIVYVFFFLLILFSSSSNHWSLVRGQMMMSYGMRRLASSLNQFGLDMLRSMEQQRLSHTSSISKPIVSESMSNINSYAFCPFCIGSSLAMLMTGLDRGANSQSPLVRDFEKSESLYESLRYALYVNSMQQQEINLAFLDLMRHLQVNLPDGFRIHRRRRRFISEIDITDPNQVKNYFTIINQLYIQRYLPIDYRYYCFVQQYYQTPIRTLDFAYAPEESRQHINAKVEHVTNGKIQNIIDIKNVGSTNSTTLTRQLSLTRLLLLSGLYFEARLDFRQLTFTGIGTRHRNRRGAFQRLWPLRSPLLQMPHQAPSIVYPTLVHSNHHQPPPNRPYFTFKSWLANQTMTTSTTTIASMATTTTTMATPFSSTLKSIIAYQTVASVQQTNSNNILQHHKFDPFKPFRLPSTKSPMRTIHKERIRLRYQHNSYLNTTVVELPFVGGIVSMLILLPDTSGSMDLMLSRLNAQLVIDLLQSLETRRLDITIPLINITHFISPTNLRQIFTTMGLSKVFDRTSSSEVDFFAGLETFSLAQMMKIYHKTVLDINFLDDNDQGEKDHPNSIEASTRIKRSSKYFYSLYESTILPSFEVKSSSMRVKTTKDRDDNDDQDDQNHPEHYQQKVIRTKQPFSMVEKLTELQATKLKHISLEEETFIYLIIDNISGLILAMGKHQS